jgi:hypothetical protein
MPDPKLSANGRAHWRAKSKLTRHLRSMTRLICLSELDRGQTIQSYQLHFVFPDNRRRDFDNFTSRCKAALDGISDAFNQDDSLWAMEAPTREIIKGRNEVKITLS